MKLYTLPALAIAILAFALTPSDAQDIGSVMPSTLPLPLPFARPIPPDKLRADNPFNLQMTGPWKFKMIHGEIVSGGQFVPSTEGTGPITASSHELANPPEHAFDGTNDTRWCADGPDLPAWLQADLGTTRHVTSINIAWERPQNYEFKIEGRVEKGNWFLLADKLAAPGQSDGQVAIAPANVRFIRLTVTGTPSGGWASIRELQIHQQIDGKDVVFQNPPLPPADLSPAVRDAFSMSNFDDSNWDTVTVPMNWEMLGYSFPTYNSVDDTVGLYRRWVVVPASFTGKKIYWHFDGALDGAEIWVNGQRAGYHESGYTAFIVDVSGLVKPGEKNLFAVRVSKTTPSDDCETGDFQAMGGIYRDTSLIAVPQTHVQDITIRTPLDRAYKNATLDCQVVLKGFAGAQVGVNGALYSSDGVSTGVKFSGTGIVGSDGSATVAMSVPVEAPKLWSAEKPNLYYVVFDLSSHGKPIERVEQRFGFRQVEVKNSVVLWNGVPIKCEGTCRHDFWADRGFALTEANWEKDLTMMKAANINAIRTSHYNHAQRFLELCEERGFYSLDEVPFLLDRQ